MLHILGWILAGLVIGAIAKLLYPGKDPGGILVTMALGIGGALLGGFIGRAIGWYGPDDNAGYIVSVIGAVIILAIYTSVAKKKQDEIGYQG
jgi:uncharacterized membrane protein YeaQ/YmgE (transglycosylase-associated protein family)